VLPLLRESESERVRLRFQPALASAGCRHGVVIADHPKWPFQARRLTTDWTLVRLHHDRGGGRGNYSERELEEWARRIAQWRRRADVLVYFNNDWEGFAVDNARSLSQPFRNE
jgi:uncharacterized protein YecE (DUF72 family)